MHDKPPVTLTVQTHIATTIDANIRLIHTHIAHKVGAVMLEILVYPKFIHFSCS